MLIWAPQDNLRIMQNFLGFHLNIVCGGLNLILVISERNSLNFCCFYTVPHSKHSDSMFLETHCHSSETELHQFISYFLPFFRKCSNCIKTHIVGITVYNMSCNMAGIIATTINNNDNDHDVDDKIVMCVSCVVCS